jgi:hypothetical protein
MTTPSRIHFFKFVRHAKTCARLVTAGESCTCNAPVEEVPAFWCPVCDHPHWLDSRWKFNGNRDKPTFGPAYPGAKSSYLSFTGGVKRYRLERIDKNKRSADTYASERAALEACPNDKWRVVPYTTPRRVYCHSHVTDGMIRVLPDSPGPFAGKTVPLPLWVLEEDGHSYHRVP